MASSNIPASGFTGWVSDLARDHTAALARIARAEGLTADDALDAVQEGFHTLLSLPQGRTLAMSADDSRALMGVIVRNAARNMRRKHHRARPHDELGEDNSPADRSPGSDELLSQAEQHIQLLGCVDRLGEVQRNIVTLRMLEEASGADVAATLELPAGHVAVLLHRAKRELLRCMMM